MSPRQSLTFNNNFVKKFNKINLKKLGDIKEKIINNNYKPNETISYNNHHLDKKVFKKSLTYNKINFIKYNRRY